MKKAIITQSNYIPWKGYFDAINTADVFIIYDDMQYTKRDWRNRNKIKTQNGVQWLSIPVEVKGKYFQKIKDTKVSDKNWAKEHWKTIFINYVKAPCFKEYKDVFESLYKNITTEYLSEINYQFIETINAILDIKTNILWSSDFELHEEKTQRLVNICKATGTTDYYSGPAAKQYMDESLFEKENIKIHYFDYAGYPVYHQLHDEFIHEVSILDILFNEGRHAVKYMKSFK